MDSQWRVERVVPAPMLKDKGGNPLVNGTCYDVTLNQGTRSRNITVVITGWAQSEAEQREPGISFTELARSYVHAELLRGWDPERCPWLTIDSQSVTLAIQEAFPSAKSGLVAT